MSDEKRTFRKPKKLASSWLEVVRTFNTAITMFGTLFLVLVRVGVIHL